MTSYVYDDLPSTHIRLVTLVKGNAFDKIRIAIEHVSFSEPSIPSYQALSYVWGSQEDQVLIEVCSKRNSSHPSSYIVSVTHNLATALESLRLQDKDRLLWIDAICINQQDISERSEEIRKMGKIYRCAAQVLVWLGPSSEQSTHAVETISHLGRQALWNPTLNMTVQHPSCDPECKDWHDETYNLPYDERTWQAIGELLTRPWFQRVWIWQEIWLADQAQAVMQCGHAIMNWQNFINGIACLDERPNVGPRSGNEHFRKLLDVIVRLITPVIDPAMLDLLIATRNSKCTDPKDRVFAMLDLASDRESLKLQANYTKSTVQVYSECTTAIMQAHDSLNVLQNCDARSWNAELPSWIPNWSEPVPYRHDLLNHASCSQGSFTVSKSGILTVEGVFCGIVDRCTTNAPPILPVETILSTIYAWAQQETITMSKLTKNQLLDALSIILSEGYIDTRSPKYVGLPSIQKAHAILSHMLEGPVNVSELDPDHIMTSPEAESLLDSISLYVPGRKLFVTGSGNLGLGPFHTQPGDRLCAILGCTTMLMLRPCEDGTHRIVGRCSLYGYLDLEGLLGPLPDGWYATEGDVGRLAEDMWFVDSQTHEKSREDPRLGKKYPDGWVGEVVEEDEEQKLSWKHLSSGKKSRQDPRHHDIQFLRQRGVDIVDVLLG